MRVNLASTFVYLLIYLILLLVLLCILFILMLGHLLLQSRGCIKYYVVFLDQFSHFVGVYALLQKSEVFSKFSHFHTYVQTQFNPEIKNFQCDNGKEFDNHEFHQLCDTYSINMRFSFLYTSQQNGKFECMLRTINNVVHTLLFQSHLPLTYLVEALHMATHLLNFFPSTAFRHDTPFHTLFN